MEIARKNVNKEIVEAGDILEWTSCYDKSVTIILVVTNVTDKDIINAVTITDGRNRTHDQNHFVRFSDTKNLKLLMKGSEVYYDFDDLELD